MKLIAIGVVVAATWSWPVPAVAQPQDDTRPHRQQMVAPANSGTQVMLHWDQPAASDSGVRGSESEVDLFLYQVEGAGIDLCRTPDQRICQIPGSADIGTGDAIELARIINRTGCDIRITIDVVVHTDAGIVNAERTFHLTVVSSDLGIAPLGGGECSDCGDDGQCHGGWGPTPP